MYIRVPGTGDADGDGVADAVDAYPLDARYSAYSDADGLADEWEQGQFAALTTADGPELGVEDRARGVRAERSELIAGQRYKADFQFFEGDGRIGDGIGQTGRCRTCCYDRRRWSLHCWFPCLLLS